MNGGSPGRSNALAENLHQGRVMAAYREIAPYGVANARAKAMLEELYAQTLNEPPKAHPPINGPARVASRALAFCEHVGRRTREMFR